VTLPESPSYALLRGRPSRAAGTLALLLLAMTAALVAARVAGPAGPWLWYYDMPKTFWPNAVFWHEAATAGAIPLWLDRLGLGFPIYAEGQIGSFYPPNWLIFRLEPLLALDVTRVLHLGIAGLGAGLMALRLAGSWSGAVLAVLVAVAGGGIVAKLEWTSLVTAYAWAPWVLLPLLRRPAPSRAGLAAAGLAFGIQALAGHPNTWVLTGLTAAAILVATRPGLAAVGRAAVVGAIGVGVGAVQVIPTAILLGLSVRAEGLPATHLFAHSATILDPLLLAFANVFVPVSPDGWDLGRIWYPGGVYGIREAAAYVGLPVLALAVVGIRARRARPLLVAMGLLVGLAVLGAMRPEWWTYVPVLNGLRHPVRAYMLAALLLGPLAAVGLARARRSPGAWRAAAGVVGLMLAAYAALAALVRLAPEAFEGLVIATLGASPETAPGIRENAAFALGQTFPVAVEAALGIAAVVLVAAAARRPATDPRRARLATLALIPVAAVPLLAISPMANPTAEHHEFSFAERPLLAAVLDAAPSRFLADADPIFHDALPNQPAAHGIADFGMWSSLNLDAVEETWRSVRDGPGVDASLAAALGIDVVATFHGEACPGSLIARVEPHDVRVCRLDGALRPPYWIPATVVREVAAEGLETPASPATGAPGGILERLAATLRPSPIDLAVDPAAVLAEARPVELRSRDDGSLELAVSAATDGWVWIDRAWWPGWETTVDGAAVTAARALGGQLVPVAAGERIVAQRFVPLEVPLGLAVGAVTLAIVIGWVALGRRRAAVGERSAGLPSRPAPKASERQPVPPPRPAAEPSEPQWAPSPPTSAAPARAASRSARSRRPGAFLDPRRAPRPSAAALFVIVTTAAAALLVAWLMPPLAIVLAWPFLFIVPGWLLVARVVPQLSPAGRLGVGAITSIFAAAHLANLVGLAAGGFDRSVAFAVVVLLAVASLVLAVAPLPRLAAPPALDLRAALQAVSRERVPFAIAGLAVLAVGGILAANAWRETAAGFVSGGWNWSDFFVHVAIGQSLAQGNFPPQVPYFAGVPLAYHWFGNFHGALLALLAGSHVIPVFMVTNGLLAGVLALVAWELARTLTGSRRAATLAALLVLLGGGMGWIRLVMDVWAGLGSPWELVQARAYDNSWDPGWPYFRIASILGTGLFPHRATAFGLPGLLAVLLLVRVSLGRRPGGMSLAGILAALLAPFHFHFFPATYLLVLLYVLTRRVWRRAGWLRDAALFLAPLPLALPFVLGPVLLHDARGTIDFVLGWGEAPLEDGLLAVGFFYATNLGLPLLLGVLAVAFARPPGRAFLAAWAVAIFAVPNLVMAGAIEFDMNKYFQVMAVALAILGGWLLRRQRLAVAGLVIAAAAVSPVLVATWHLRSEPVVLNHAQERAARWILANTPQRSVFVTDAFINSPVDYAGRLRISTFGPYVANLGYDPAPRAADTRAVYCDGPEVAAAVMARHGATYVLSPGGDPGCPEGAEPTDFAGSPLFETVYDVDGVRIWRLRG
jgi:hypothetical protein